MSERTLVFMYGPARRRDIGLVRVATPRRPEEPDDVVLDDLRAVLLAWAKSEGSGFVANRGGVSLVDLQAAVVHDSLRRHLEAARMLVYDVTVKSSGQVVHGRSIIGDVDAHAALDTPEASTYRSVRTRLRSGCVVDFSGWYDDSGEHEGRVRVRAVESSEADPWSERVLPCLLARCGQDTYVVVDEHNREYPVDDVHPDDRPSVFRGASTALAAGAPTRAYTETNREKMLR